MHFSFGIAHTILDFVNAVGIRGQSPRNRRLHDRLIFRDNPEWGEDSIRDRPLPFKEPVGVLALEQHPVLRCVHFSRPAARGPSPPEIL